MKVPLLQEFNELNDSIVEIKKLVSEVSLRSNDLDWVTTEDMKEYSDLLRTFQEKVPNIK